MWGQIAAAGISAAGSALSGKGISTRKYRVMTRLGHQLYNKYALPALRAEQDYSREQDEIFRNRAIQGRVADAKAAGLHPLFALGGNVHSGGSYSVGGSPGGPAPQGGGSPEGAALASIGRQMQRAQERREQRQHEKDMLERQAQLSAIQVAKNNVSNDTAAALVDMHMKRNMPTRYNYDPAIQEVKKGEVQTHLPGQREQSGRVTSPMTKFRIGSQNVWVAAEDLESFTEDPLAVGIMTMGYHGNKNVNWWQLIRDFTGNKKINVPDRYKRITKGRHPPRYYITPKRRYSRQDQFIPYSRGPHR
jgi:hypothetical protein